jgi:hypothetical protein
VFADQAALLGDGPIGKGHLAIILENAPKSGDDELGRLPPLPIIGALFSGNLSASLALS